MAAVVLNILFLVAEILLLMIGYSLFFDRLNIIQILLHLLGALFLTWFVMDLWGYNLIWGIWFAFGLIPFTIEVFIVLAAKKLYKSK